MQPRKVKIISGFYIGNWLLNATVDADVSVDYGPVEIGVRRIGPGGVDLPFGVIAGLSGRTVQTECDYLGLPRLRVVAEPNAIHAAGTQFALHRGTSIPVNRIVNVVNAIPDYIDDSITFTLDDDILEIFDVIPQFQVRVPGGSWTSPVEIGDVSLNSFVLLYGVDLIPGTEWRLIADATKIRLLSGFFVLPLGGTLT